MKQLLNPEVVEQAIKTCLSVREDTLTPPCPECPLREAKKHNSDVCLLYESEREYMTDKFDNIRKQPPLNQERTWDNYGKGWYNTVVSNNCDPLQVDLYEASKLMKEELT